MDIEEGKLELEVIILVGHLGCGLLAWTLGLIFMRKRNRQASDRVIAALQLIAGGTASLIVVLVVLLLHRSRRTETNGGSAMPVDTRIEP